MAREQAHQTELAVFLKAGLFNSFSISCLNNAICNWPALQGCDRAVRAECNSLARHSVNLVLFFFYVDRLDLASFRELILLLDRAQIVLLRLDVCKLQLALLICLALQDRLASRHGHKDVSERLTLFINSPDEE